MIQPNELRIGNWILINGTPVPVGYGLIMDCAQQAKGINNAYLDKLSFDPIPLTPEILEKARLDKIAISKDGGKHIIYRIAASIAIESNNGVVQAFTYSSADHNDLPHIKSLHQLQNLYFALTGTELTYTPCLP